MKPGLFLRRLIPISLLLLLIIGWVSIEIPPFQLVQNQYLPSDVWVVDQHGLPMEIIRTKNKERSLEWVKWDEVSPSFKNLVVKVEDKRFHDHFGIDFLALSHAFWQRITGQSYRGASTISMQLVGLMRKDKTSPRRNVWQKISQLAYALKLDLEWDKNEILEAYINLLPFRGELIGLRAATHGFFGKGPQGLMQEESALLVALIRSPNAKAEMIAKRACNILNLSDCSSVDRLSQNVFDRPYNISRKREIIPVLSKRFIENSIQANTIKTTLNLNLQTKALNALREQLKLLKRQNVNDGAVLILETASGKVLAYAANAGPGFTTALQVDGIQTRRQAGSTIKPFVYATAFDQRLLYANSLLEDSPADISIGQGRVYHPRNYDHAFRGLVSASEALGSSINVPAVRVLQLTGEEAILERLRNLGFEKLETDEYYGPSLALGTVDVTLWELTNAYRQLATDNSIFKSSTRQAIFNALALPEYRRFTFGLDSILSLPFPAAVKTGTSKDMRDNWCIGWTDQYTIGVWVGNFHGEPMWNVSGLSGAAPIWRNLMMEIGTSTNQGIANYVAPANALARKSLSRIRYPAPDMLVGLDPDIPKDLQKLPIEIDNPQANHQVYINDHYLDTASETLFLPIETGKFKIELKSARGDLIDAVKIEVR